MLIEEIYSLTENPESGTLEFKKSLSQLKKGFETICGFLNRKGGKVIFGVKDNGNIVGEDISDSTKKEISNEIAKIEPFAEVDVHYVKFNSKFIIVLSVEKGANLPYTYNGRAYLREQSATRKMKQEYYNELLIRRSPKFSWGSLSSIDHKIDDLDFKLFKKTIDAASHRGRIPTITVEKDNLIDVLERLKLLNSGRLNNAAVVLFSNKEDSTYLQCQIKVARFKGVDRQEFIDNNLFRGNLFELLAKASMFVRMHIPVSARIEPGILERIETPLIPLDAIREALINALCHKDYSNESGSIGVAIYDDRLEVFNDAYLRPDTDIEKIRQGYSNPPNSIISDICYKAGLIEKWGRGIPGIIEKCNKANVAEPKFTIDNLEFKVIFKFPSSIAPPVIEISNNADNKINKTKDKDKDDNDILSVLKAYGPLSTSEIQNKLNKKISARRLRDKLNSMLSNDEINVIGKTRSRKWIIKQ